MTQNKESNAGAGSVLSTVSGPSDASTSPDLKSLSTETSRLAEKVNSGQALSARVTSNPNKENEYGLESTRPQEGATHAPDDILATASTASENADSEKVGTGKVEEGVNANISSLDSSRVNSIGQRLTTNQGVPVADNQHSLKAGLRGPTLMEDFIFREKMTHFDHERIPERVVHARGSAAHGYFESYSDFSSITCAAPFAAPGKTTPVFVRFSTVGGERGSADTVRDVRGFAVKFYTDEGNWDLVGNNIPVFFIQDAMKFPDLVHALKPEPHNAIPQASSAHDTFWDFVSLMPESAHMLMWQMSDRTIPRSYRMMQGFGVHTFRFVNSAGDSVFCKFHWNPMAGTHSLVWDEAGKLMGVDPDFHRRDLWEAIEAGAFPQWELGVQIFTEEQAEQFEFDVLDPTKLIPEEMVPLTPLGKMTLNRNPDEFFPETEQVAFCTAHIIPGIDFTNDPLLQGRIHSYVDTQISRLGGVNFHEIPINSPIAPVHNNQRDGAHRRAISRGRVNYEPNSLAGGCPFQAGSAGFMSFPQPVVGDKVRGKPEKFAEHYGQARMFYESQTEAEKNHIADAFRFELSKVQTPAVRQRVLALLANVHTTLCGLVAEGLGMDVPMALPLATSSAVPFYEPSPALSLMARPGAIGIETRRVAILVGVGVDAVLVGNLYDGLLQAGAVPRLVGSRLGKVVAADGSAMDVEISLEAGPSVMYDGVVIPDGIEAIKQQTRVMEFLWDQYRHCKPMLVIGSGLQLLEAASIPLYLPNGDEDESIVIVQEDDDDFDEEVSDAQFEFHDLLAGPREFLREENPILV